MTKKAKTAKIGGRWAGQVPDFARRIGEAARARRVILFGSGARGDMRDDSDLDFLVVIPDHLRHMAARRRARRSLSELEFALKCPDMDLYVARENEVRQLRRCPHGPVKFALDEGVEVWHAA